MFIVAGFPLAACKTTGNLWHVGRFLVAQWPWILPITWKLMNVVALKSHSPVGCPCPPTLLHQKMAARTTAIGWFPGDSFLSDKLTVPQVLTFLYLGLTLKSAPNYKLSSLNLLLSLSSLVTVTQNILKGLSLEGTDMRRQPSGLWIRYALKHIDLGASSQRRSAG